MWLLKQISTNPQYLSGLLLTNLVGILVVIIDNAARRVHEVRLHLRKSRIDVSISRVRTQLEELYGPLSSLLSRNQLVIERVQSRPALFQQFQLQLFKEIVLPNNQKAVKLLEEKYHLIDGDFMPQSFKEFLAHADWLRVVFEETGSPKSEPFPFPKEFATDVEAHRTRLMGKLKHYMEDVQKAKRVVSGVTVRHRASAYL